MEAAQRKLKEECNLDITLLDEVATFDLLFTVTGATIHDVTILFKTEISSNCKIEIDNQSKAYGWFTSAECSSLNLHPYMHENTTGSMK